MAGISTDVLRTGKTYRLVNHGEAHEFTVEKILANGDFLVKDLLTLERYHLNELIAYGKGKDYLLEEVRAEE
ncbi:MAG TPA: hypothetical protein VKZ86_14040 [Cyclobacteriaceae bacterium]|nr:hypothetical protein [Cyclobacteriaceae bacterium]